MRNQSCGTHFGRPAALAGGCLLAALALSGCLPLQFGFEPPATASTRVARVTLPATTATPEHAQPAATETRLPLVAATSTTGPTASATLAGSAVAPASATHTATDRPTPRPIEECALTHTVRQGEGLFAIGALYGVRWQDIASLNGLDNPSLIFAGQVLCLPPDASPPVTPTRTSTPTATGTGTPTSTRTPSPAPDPCENPPSWFFAPAPEGCASAAPLNSQAAAQRFEHGQMLWVEAIDEYFVLFDGASQGAPGNMLHLPAPLAFNPGASPDNRVPETPPPGLQQPVSGFGLIWRGEVAGTAGVRAALGWATQAEFGYAATYQCQAALADVWHCYLRAPNGQVLRVSFIPQQGYFWQPH